MQKLPLAFVHTKSHEQHSGNELADGLANAVRQVPGSAAAFDFDIARDRRLAQAQRRAVACRHVLLAKFSALLRSRTTLPQPCPTFSQFSELSLRPRALVL